jgi:hypothetical protein
VPVVLGHRRQPDVGDLAVVERKAQHAVVGAVDPVRRVRVHADGHDRAPQLVGAAGQRDLLRRTPLCRLAELRERLLVEREDEVRLGLDLAVEIVAERRIVERDPGPQEVLLQHCLGWDAGEARDQLLDEGRA